jgi:hypothetical protein
MYAHYFVASGILASGFIKLFSDWWLMVFCETAIPSFGCAGKTL